MDSRTVSRRLQCDLTSTERDARARSLVDELGQKAATEARHKEAKIAMRAEIQGHDLKIERLRVAVETGHETRDVICDEVKDYEAGLVRIIRRDTSAEVEVRPLTDEERQQGLPGTEDEEEDAEALEGAFQAGQAAAFDGDDECPYDEGSALRAEWERGHRAATGGE